MARMQHRPIRQEPRVLLVVSLRERHADACTAILLNDRLGSSADVVERAIEAYLYVTHRTSRPAWLPDPANPPPD